LKTFYKLLYFSLLLVTISCSKNVATQEKKGNDLIHETSPYLLQHAYNPVNWKAWNTATLELAKKEKKLMVISIGFSACHWCHVMEEESFENDSIAKIMNANFINIKVDREERPDVDKVYMNAVQLLTGSGGWPLNCIALPDGRPIFGGTYFTKKQWSKILIDISKLYRENPKKIIEYAEQLTQGIQESQLVTLNKEASNFNNEDIISAVSNWEKHVDKDYGGFKGAPKFPMPNSLEFLLRYSYQFNDSLTHKYVNNTLTKIAYGGIYDHVGGGFSRYSIDSKWHIPHFEKMLYDNAQLVSLYSKAYLLENNKLFKNVVEETLSFINKELTAENGAFYSSLDADSKNQKNESEEGEFYAWTEEELKIVINEDYKLFKEYYNINEYGFWEHHKYVLIRDQSKLYFAINNALSTEDLDKKVLLWKSKLYNARSKRNKPNLDDKILTSWNALMLQGYLDAYKAFGDTKYLQSAIRNAEFIAENQLRKDNGLYRNYKAGKSTINAYSEDYATVMQAFISLYEVTLDEKWLFISKKLADYMFNHFYDTKNKMFYFTSNEDENLISRKVEVVDGVIASSNSILGISLFKLGHYFSNKIYTETSKQMLNNLKLDIKTNPSSHSNWLNLMLNLTKPFYEVVIAGNNASKVNNSFINNYLPNIIIAGTNKETGTIPLVLNKYNTEDTFIYVCVNGTCKLPQTDINRAIKSIDK
jgi:uncharacterized protein YyaL (SSP411 family)